MKLNLNVIKIILSHIEIEDFDDWLQNAKEPEIKDYVDPKAVILGHIELLLDGGLLKHGKLERNAQGDFEYYDLRGMYLTLRGHELLNALKNKTFFEEIKTLLKNKGLSLSLEVLMSAIPVVIKKLIEN